ncbi:MAG: tellurite resistance TerB family protein [Pseudomonadota bacterium]
MNFGDIVGEMLRQGMSPQTQQRIEHATGPQGLGGEQGSADLGAILGSVLGGSSSGGGSAGGLGDVLGGLLGGQSGGSGGQGGGLADVLGSVLGGGQASGGQSAGGQSAGGLGDILGNLGGMLGSPSGVGGMSKGELGGLGALAGAILGGGGSSAKGAVGGSAMAILGTLALSALKNWQAQSAAGGNVNALGLSETEVQQISAPETAELCLRGMIEAIKSDGQVSQGEIERLTGKLAEGGITSEEKQFVQAQMSKPADLAGLVRDIPNPEVGIQVYAAALMAISVDTPAEKVFLHGLAEGTGIAPDAVARLHQMVGAPSA